MKKQYFILFLLLVMTLLSFSSVFADSGQFTVSNNIYFTGTSSDPGQLYLDAYGANSDVGIEICDVGQRFVGGFYALNENGAWDDVLVTYSTSSNALAFTDVDQGGNCYATAPGFVTVSPSQLTTPDPSVFKAALPGNLWIGHDVSANPGTVSNFIYSNGFARLLGDYSIARSFSQSTREVSIQTPQITFTTSSGSFSKSASDASYGISSDRKLVVGLCSDDYGSSCTDGVVMSSPVFPASFSTGLTPAQINDQNTYTRYVVANSIGKEMCIGANLQATISSVQPNPIYYSQDLVVNFSVRNPRNTPYEVYGGNVGVTTNFDVNISIYETAAPSNVVYSNSFQMSNDLAPDVAVPVSFIWPAYAHSGTYTVRVDVDVNNAISECNELDNYVTQNFQLLPITLPEIYIDGEENDTFPQANIPYDMTFHLKNSDNDILSNATIVLEEINGLNLALPTQIFNRSINGAGGVVPSGVITSTKANLITDYYGNVSFVFMPTHNHFYDPEFSYLDLKNHVGNYSLQFYGSQSNGEPFKFVNNNVLYSKYTLSVLNNSVLTTFPNKNLANENFVAQMLDFVHQTYVNFLNTIVLH